jgi:hypothetical protein
MFNGTKKVIDIVATGANWTVILSTGPVVYAIVKESLVTSAGVANVPQGILYQLWDTNARAWGPTLASGSAQIPAFTIGDEMTSASSHGSTIGQGPQTLGMGLPATPATPLFRAQSLTATATSLEVSQFYS